MDAARDEESDMQYIAIQNDDVSETYLIDTDEKIREAQEAMKAAGIDRLPVWNGDPDDPDSYKDSVRVFTSD